MAAPRLAHFALPLQVAAVCYRLTDSSPEFLLVKTCGGSKWTFPKGDPERSLTHSQAAAQEALEEAGVQEKIEARHFHLYLHSKGTFWKPSGVREYVVKAFLLHVDHLGDPHENERHPRWFSPEEARKILSKGREVKYAREIQSVIDHALKDIATCRADTLVRLS